MSSMNAWILDFGMEEKAALGARELLHLIDVPTTFKVPCAPSYCHKVVSWQGRMLPVMDVASRFNGAAQEEQFIAVVGYQQKRGAYPEFGALLMTTPPRQVAVSDEQACELPESLLDWSEFVISCFDYQGAAIPVLNLNMLFNPPQHTGKDM